MSANKFLIDTNILIYHTKGSQVTVDFINRLVEKQAFNISILTRIEFLGWDKHTPEGFEKCRRLIELANVIPLDQDVANKAIELKTRIRMKLADAAIAATALLNGLTLATRNLDDFKSIKELQIMNPLG